MVGEHLWLFALFLLARGRTHIAFQSNEDDVHSAAVFNDFADPFGFDVFE